MRLHSLPLVQGSPPLCTILLWNQHGSSERSLFSERPRPLPLSRPRLVPATAPAPGAFPVSFSVPTLPALTDSSGFPTFPYGSGPGGLIDQPSPSAGQGRLPLIEDPLVPLAREIPVDGLQQELERTILVEAPDSLVIRVVIPQRCGGCDVGRYDIAFAQVGD